MKFLYTSALLFSILALTAVHATAGENAMMMKSPLAGSWTLRTVDNIMPDGSRVHLYGDMPQGLLIFGKDGRYSLQIMRGDKKPFASNDKAQATAMEYHDAYLASNTHFGHYMLDQSASAITFHIEHASYPNWEGKDSVEKYTLKDDVLTYIVAMPTTGKGAVGEVVWVKNRMTMQ
jgi:hypothetical protein